MTKKIVVIEDGCISCGMCEDICPDVFEMSDVAEVIDGADIEANEEAVKEAAESCPVDVIKLKQE